MGYIDEQLMPGEQLVYRTRLHWFVFAGPILILTLGFGVPQISLIIFIGVLVLVGALSNYLTTEIGVTDTRVIGKTGFLRTISLETQLDGVEGIEVEQGSIARIVGYGKVIVLATGGEQTPFSGIAQPFELRRIVNQQIEERGAV